VVRIGRGLGMGIVAEGVETEFEARMMTKLGCTELQGYYYSKPLDTDQMIELLGSFQPKRPLRSKKPMAAMRSSGTTSVG
jgi:EAL domain-containing protein (putative c-di-GMP-specific phosphodiesterase class I)